MKSTIYGTIDVTKYVKPRRVTSTRGVAHEHWRFTMQDKSTTNDNSIPYGFCHCGCGQKTRISDMTNRTHGYVKGEPRRYVRGHNGKTQPNKWHWDSGLECYRVVLPGDEFMLVDTDDAPLLRQYHWNVNTKRGKTGYVFHTSKNSNGTSNSIYAHRLITNAPAGMVVDHINGEGRDNRRSNLRVCSNTENQRNRSGLHALSKTGYTGVCLPSKSKKWQAGITAGGNYINLGTFLCPIEAAIARDIAAIQLHGEFASLNFPNLKSVFASEEP